MSDELRIGVFVCDCGLNIAGTVDTEEVSRFAETLPDVAAVAAAAMAPSPAIRNWPPSGSRRSKPGPCCSNRWHLAVTTGCC